MEGAFVVTEVAPNSAALDSGVCVDDALLRFVAAAGAVDHDEVVAEVSRRFDRFGGDIVPAPVAGHYAGGDERKVRKQDISLVEDI